MSIAYVRSVFRAMANCEAWILQLIRISSIRQQTNYSCCEITLDPAGKLQEYASYLIDQYDRENRSLIDIFSSVNNYDGTSERTTIYRLNADDPLIHDEYERLTLALASPEIEADPLTFRAHAYMLQGVVSIDDEDVGVKLFSMQKPITTLKHKFRRTVGTFEEIGSGVLSLRSSIDVLIVGNTVYFLNMSGENLFNMERSYKAVCTAKVHEIEEYNIVSNPEMFRQVASTGHNPRRFISYNPERLETLRIPERRIALATKFAIPLVGERIDTSTPPAVDKLVKLLCKKGMVDPFDDRPVEVPSAKSWI